ncbi:MAG: galactokinase [Clostridiales bacterium]|nr:galactokinase [Clostridiales bacterium]
MYEELKTNFSVSFDRPWQYIFSAPGRTELGGNHTDHQLGRVLAAAVDLDSTAAAAENGESLIRVISEGYPMCIIDLADLLAKPEELGSTAALVRGVAAGIAQRGHRLRGFDAYVSSRVLPGSGLSSSAAFEVLMGTIINHISGCGLTPVEIAQIGQYAENVHFGKPCGLMDQMASSVGNIIGIDFENPLAPLTETIDYDFSRSGYSLCIIDCGADHADLTDEYAAIPGELEKVCAFFGKQYLRQVDEALFYSKINELRRAVGDRAVLRAMHVFEENKRVEKEIAALKANDFEGYLAQVRASGRSSWLYLQNVVPAGYTEHQELAFALALADRLLNGRGACRVHGGGFAGTIQAFVPDAHLHAFRSGMDAVLGKGACHILSIRRQGGVLLEERK